MRYTLTIQADGAAFGETDTDRAWAVAAILKSVATDLENFGSLGAVGPVRYPNGNRVGQLTLTED